MKKIVIMALVAIGLIVTSMGFGQGFISAIEDEGLGALYGNACTIKLKSGDVVLGKFVGGNYVNDGLTKITIKLANDEKVKYVPEDVVSLSLHASSLLKLFLVSESGSSIKEFSNTDFNEIINRDSIIFETARTPKKTDKYRLLQLINPGFDSKIKVYAEPNKKTGGLSMGGLQITGGEDAAFLFVKGDEKAIMVKKGSYAKDFEELFADCPKMLSEFKGEKIKWQDVALHVYVYDQLCK